MARKERRDEKVGREKGLTVSLSVLSIRSVTGYPSVRRHLFSIELNPFLLIFTSAIGPRYFPILGKNREETRDLLAPRSGRSNGLSKRAVTEFIHFTIREGSTLHRYSATSNLETEQRLLVDSRHVTIRIINYPRNRDDDKIRRVGTGRAYHPV